MGPKITLHDARMGADMQTMLLNHHSFHFHHTFNAAATNSDVYAGAVTGMIPLPLTGGVATVMAYGQTGSGKTFTMTSIYEAAAEDLFRAIGEQPRCDDITVSVSYLEVSHKTVCDLLGEGKAVKLIDSTAVGAVEVDVADADDLIAIIRFGQRVRATSETGVHDASSRSHSVLRIYVQTAPSKKDGIPEKEGMLVLVVRWCSRGWT
jgi:kinesin family protein 2/24